MSPASGETVKVHYKGKLADGTVFDSSEGGDPLEFTVGAGEVIPGFDSAVAGLEVGTSKTVTIPAAEAYGERNEEALQAVPREAFSEEPQVGYMVELTAPDGERMAATIADICDDTVTLDFNHPLAGEDLTFDIELVDVANS